MAIEYTITEWELLQNVISLLGLATAFCFVLVVRKRRDLNVYFVGSIFLAIGLATNSFERLENPSELIQNFSYLFFLATIDKICSSLTDPS